MVWARRRPPPAEGRRRREGSRPACVTGEQCRRVARRDRDSASRVVSLAGQSRGDRSRRRPCFTWNTPAERPRGRGPSVGEQLSLASSFESASCHGSLWAAGLFRGESQRDSRGVSGRHAPGLGATARANHPRLTPAHQPGGRRSTTLRRCTVLPGHCTLFADAGQVSARGAAPPPYGSRAPSPPRARPGASRGRVSRAAAVTARTSVGGLVQEPARRATPPHRWMVTRALFRRQRRRISPRFGRRCARRGGPGEPSQSRPAMSYKSLSLCARRPKCGESGASKGLHARALSGEAPGLGVRTGARRGAASPVVRLIGRCRRVGRQTRMRCHGCSEVATTRHPLTGACGRLRRDLALEAGLAPGLRGKGAHRLLGLRPAPSPANPTPPGVARRPTITGGRSASVHPTQGVEPRRCGDGCAFWLLAWHAPDPR